MASRLRLTAPLVLIGLSVGLAVWLGVAGPRVVRREAAVAFVAEQELLAHQGAARIPASVVRQLFTPFFTTKPPETGTGLGLSVCADIVARHGGRIRGENRGDRRGARFVVELPVS